MEVKIEVKTENPTPNQTKNLKISLEDLEWIGDLKARLQPLLQVAACDMAIYLKTRVPGQCDSHNLENATRLASLYLQEDDTFVVVFPSICDICTLTQVLSIMREFVRDICENSLNGQEASEISVDWNRNIENDMSASYFHVMHSLERCSYNLFIPWSSSATNANRHFFSQEGGLLMLAYIYNFASTKHYGPPASEEKRYIVKSFNENQVHLEMWCLFCLWNFSEIKEDRQLVMKHIGIGPFIDSLLKTTPDDIDLKESPIIGVNEAATGCLAQYSELPDIEQVLASSKEVLEKLLWLSFNGSSIYNKEVAVNTLFCCSNHPKAARKIIESKFYHLVLEEARKLLNVEVQESEQDVSLPFSPATAYFLCLFLANIQTLPEENLLTTKERIEIDQILEAFFAVVKPRTIGEFQKEHNYVWITLFPFVQLALSGPKGERYQNVQQQISQSGEMDTESVKIFKEQKKSYRSPYTFTPAGKLGLFCLQHLVNSEENRELLRGEKLVDYLICACWFAQRCPNVSDLVPGLSSFTTLEPPRLESIAKAYLSKSSGISIK